MDPNYFYDPNSIPWWAESINRGIDVVGARVGQGAYVSPDDPRFRQTGGGWITPGGQIVNTPGGPALSPGAVNAGGFTINWWTAALLGIVVGAFLLGKRGR